MCLCLPRVRCVPLALPLLLLLLHWQARFVGHTADMVTDMFKSAQGGVLFIDEAHNLAPTEGGGSFKKEAIAAIVTAMTGEFKNKVLVVLLGYVRQGEDMLQ